MATSIFGLSRASRVALLVGVLCAFPGTAGTGQRQKLPERLPFADDAGKQPEFQAFRDGLLSMAERGQYASIRKIIDRSIQYESSASGLSAFENEWEIRKSTAAFLREFKEVLRLGGRFRDDGQTFVAPYVLTDFPDVEDLFFYAVVVHPSTKLYMTPNRSAKVISTLSNEVMRYDNSRVGWYEVKLVDGRTGFVEAARVRQPDDYHATFRRIGGQWRLAEFFGGSH